METKGSDVGWKSGSRAAGPGGGAGDEAPAGGEGAIGDIGIN